MQLSPSGKYVAVLAPIRGRLGLAVFDVLSRTATPAASVNGYDITTFQWANDQRLVFSVSDLERGLGQQTGGGLFAINRDGSEFRELAPTIQQTMNSRHYVWRHTDVLQTLDDGSDDVLVTANDKNELYPDVYRMNTKTGRKTLMSWDRPGDVTHWVADRDGMIQSGMEKGINESHDRLDDQLICSNDRARGIGLREDIHRIAVVGIGFVLMHGHR